MAARHARSSGTVRHPRAILKEVATSQARATPARPSCRRSTPRDGRSGAATSLRWGMQNQQQHQAAAPIAAPTAASAAAEGALPSECHPDMQQRRTSSALRAGGAQELRPCEAGSRGLRCARCIFEG
eukprot:351532-Chlamydomonas_euryale.AAC.2